MPRPTLQIYSELQTAYDHFNKELFGGQLPECILTLDSKEKRVRGYYRHKQFIHQGGEPCDGIALNPQHFETRKIQGIMQILVHEMCHLWQAHFGENSPTSYHDKEWSDKMESLGLMPSNTGAPGGKKTGQKMYDYPLEAGMFLKACDGLLTPEYRISWRDRFSVAPEAAPLGNKSLRMKYSCSCPANIWGKPGLNVLCGECGEPFQPKIG